MLGEMMIINKVDAPSYLTFDNRCELYYKNRTIYKDSENSIVVKKVGWEFYESKEEFEPLGCVFTKTFYDKDISLGSVYHCLSSDIIYTKCRLVSLIFDRTTFTPKKYFIDKIQVYVPLKLVFSIYDFLIYCENKIRIKGYSQYYIREHKDNFELLDLKFTLLRKIYFDEKLRIFVSALKIINNYPKTNLIFLDNRDFSGTFIYNLFEKTDVKHFIKIINMICEITSEDTVEYRFIR